MTRFKNILRRLLGSDSLPPPPEDLTAGIGYVPLIRSSREVARWTLGDHHHVRLLTDVRALGHVEYAHVLTVQDEHRALLYVVAAEVNNMATMLGGGSHFLAVYDDDGHSTVDDDDAWGDLDRFCARALEMASARFDATAQPAEP